MFPAQSSTNWKIFMVLQRNRMVKVRNLTSYEGVKWTLPCKCKKIVEITYTAVYSSLVVSLYRFIHGSLFAVHDPGSFI